MSSLSEQQRQTLSFFRRHSDEWQRRAKSEGGDEVNVAAQRNACVLRTAETMRDLGAFLDIGCGSGDLVLEMAARNVVSTGIDFADEMITHCEKKRRDQGRDNAKFVLGSVFGHDAPDGGFDLISALGLIEYISRDELNDLANRCRRWLRAEGMLVIGSRNRLFNLFSLNDYTRLEMDLGTLESLMEEAVTIGKTATGAEAIERLKAFSADIVSPDAHPSTGIDVATRHQYTPGELIRLLARSGIETETMFAVHYHAFPPGFARAHGRLHADAANYLFETAADDHLLIPSSSSFVLAARKDR